VADAAGPGDRPTSIPPERQLAVYPTTASPISLRACGNLSVARPSILCDDDMRVEPER
jgi:hypothetical protein